MKKFITTVLCLVLIAVSSFAQKPALQKGSNVIDAGIGFSSGISNISIPPIAVSYEHIFVTFGGNDQWGVGAGAFGEVLSQKSFGSNYFGGGISAQGNMHFSPVANLDIYAGLNTGYVKVITDGISVGSTSVGEQIGVRYFFKDGLGAFLQVGGFGTINLGISFKF